MLEQQIGLCDGHGYERVHQEASHEMQNFTASVRPRGLRTLTTQKSTVQGARSGARARQGLAKPLAAEAS
jgi:hypothetical protein